jgi:hypothetical protein
MPRSRFGKPNEALNQKDKHRNLKLSLVLTFLFPPVCLFFTWRILSLMAKL